MPKYNLDDLPENAAEREFRTHRILVSNDQYEEVDAILLAFSTKRTTPSMGDASPRANLRLYINRKGLFLLAFEKVEADGTPIAGSVGYYRHLDQMAQRMRVDKMNKRIADLMGVRHLMSDMEIEDLG